MSGTLLRHSLGPGAGRAECVSVYLGQVWVSRRRLANEASSWCIQLHKDGSLVWLYTRNGYDALRQLCSDQVHRVSAPEGGGDQKLSLINAPLRSLFDPKAAVVPMRYNGVVSIVEWRPSETRDHDFIGGQTWSLTLCVATGRANSNTAPLGVFPATHNRPP